MPIINVLPLNLRNKIAAGEVVERPASVVKEFIENSIDAKSTRISIVIMRAGKKLIRVSDNGLGMDREDALLAFERYATSKLRDEKDLFSISTMGFRGEALSSIAAVAKVRLVTALRQPSAVNNQLSGKNNETVGTCIEIMGGEIKEVKDCPATGTTIEVKDLFFNTPARRKFLKSDTTENYHITDTVTRVAVSHPHIGFVLRMDGDDVLNLPAASSFRERLMQIYGKELCDNLLETRPEDSLSGVRAFLGNSANLRNNKNNQFIFVNSRPVKDQSISYSVYRGYEGLIPKEKHPVFFLFLEIDPEKVDFNVHPAKREVRFSDKNSIFNVVLNSVKAAVRNQMIAEGPLDAEPLNGQMEGTYERPGGPPSYSYTPDSSSSYFAGQSSLQSNIAEPQHLDYSGFIEKVPFLYLGDTIVAVAGRNGLTLIDYHAAHERVNYEMLLKSSAGPSFRLLFPAQVKLHGSEYRVILKNLPMLKELGLEVEDFGHDTVIVRGLPEILKDADLNSLMSDVADSLTNEARPAGDEKISSIDNSKKAIAARMACHKSIRGKEVPDSARLAELIKSLDAADSPNTCPHGRPTRISITLDEMKKMFRKA
ncbi:MAG: DNA mismatch repair endonuclease MutL [Deltaproteobacteria bacterium]|nr:DNA mismatch repair endonuclease MutL [Deltaproteobacteria bacterium]